MRLDHFPFAVVTVTALFIHIASAALATLLKPIWKGDTFLDRWWQPASFMRVFTVARADVNMPLAWVCIVTARIAFAIFAVSLTLDLCIN
jgi:hypothetical protein